MFGGFFDGRRVLVTGVGGVKGTWLALLLLDAGADVLGVDIQTPNPDSNFIASGLGSRIAFIQGDITDLALARRLIGEADAIFHLAALALVHDAYRNPLEAYRTNTLGPATVLEAIRLSAAPKRAVFVTTDKVYRPKNGELWVETDPLGASGPYAVSKACAEFIIADYQRAYFNSSGSLIGVARAGNVLIGGDLHSSSKTHGSGRIFVDCFEALVEQRSPEIFSPNFTRPYTYGLDVLCGYMSLMAKLDNHGVAGEAFNFGPYEQHGIPNALLAAKICKVWGGNTMWRAGNPRDEPFEYQSLAFDKSRERLDWSPAYTLYEAIDGAARWYKEWAHWRKESREGGLAELNASLINEHRRAAARLGIPWALRARNAAAYGAD
jgi:CDP-glucose 4,6-dehydratase